MPTQSLVLNDEEFKQITDGTNYACVTVVRNSGYSEMVWADADEKPAADAAAHEQAGMIIFSPPLSVWIKSRSGNSLIRLTTWTAE